MGTLWDAILDHLRGDIAEEDFRRWFGATAYASDLGDQLTVWVPSEGVRRHLERTYQQQIERACAAAGRPETTVRLVVAGEEEDET
jgi:chromosomal replication initiation ATPase DnaA